jgi:photosystem II stability/assembly factor-like uncharacterized protein
MSHLGIRRWAVALSSIVSLPLVAATSSDISGLGVRNIGSASMSGRISAIAAREEIDGKVTVYIGAASGGVWKSEDGGTSYKPVFDKQPVQSIGALALDPNNPSVVWVGTGESWTRNSVSIGDGIYKSSDGGQTWTNLGLPNSERITRIVVHPKNGDIVYACVPGKLWSDSADRGLYKTTDGGKTWALILKGANLSTGCSSVTLDPQDPEAVLAGLWDFRRKGWTFRSGGDGPTAFSGSGMYRSADGGGTWVEMTSSTNKGLPAKPWGRVEVVFAPSNRKQIYAAIENVRSALYVSEDGGATWEERDRSRNMVWRPFYFQRLVVDPNNDKRVFKMNLRMIVSDDGGKSFADAAGSSHADWHDIWINPNNSKHIIGGDDGGMWYSYDGGVKWWKGDNLPISQFYHVSVNNNDPYQVFGGLQDNSSWVGDSAYPGGITNDRWENLYGGDGFWTFEDPTDPNFVYAEYQGGNISRIDRRTMQSRDIQPKGGYREKLRFNWNTPIHLSPNEKGTIYIGAQFLFRSRDQGTNWERISPDLSTNDPQKQRQEESGGITVDNSSAEMHTTIYSISESPRNGKVIWVGTDDGNIQLTRDGGAKWTNVVGNVRGVPKASWVSWVEASRHADGTAYATFDRHTYGDMTPYLYKTTDFGRTWQRLIGPDTKSVRGYAHVVREDLVASNVLYVGTELGLFVSVDGGANWAEFKPSHFPAVAVRDIALQTRDHDLVLGTHGRGIWIVDDVTPLRALSAEVLNADAALIAGRPVQQRIQGNGGWSEGDAKFSGTNPPDGAVITYYQKSRHVLGRLKLEVLDAQGNVVETLPTAKRKGLNRVEWTMRTKPPVVPPAATLAFSATRGPRVLPGEYTVRLTKAGKEYTMPLTVGLDRRATFTFADRKAQFDAASRVKDLFARMSLLVAKINAVRGQSAAMAEKRDAKDPLCKELAQIESNADAIRKQIVATKEGGAITGEERLREQMDYAYGAVMSVESAPTPYALARIDALERELGEVEAAFATLAEKELAPLNKRLESKQMPAISIAQVSAPVETARGGSASVLARGLVGPRFIGTLPQPARGKRRARQ